MARAFAGERFSCLDAAAFELAPGQAPDFAELLAALGEAPAQVVHLWGVTGGPGAALDRGFYSLLFLAQALGKRELPRPAELLVVTAGLQTVADDAPSAVQPMPGFGSAGFLPPELPNVVWRFLDLPPAGRAGRAGRDNVEPILAEMAQAGAEPWVALRDGRRYARSFEIVPVVSPAGLPEATKERAADLPQRIAPGAGHPRPALANPYVAPESAVEQRIADVWQEILGLERVGVHDNFFELGGNSLAGIRLISRLKETLEVNVSEVTLYEAPTVAALVRLLGPDDAGSAEEVIVPAFEGSRSRGERRKARQLQKSRAGDPA